MAFESHDNNNSDFVLEAHDEETYYEDDYDDDYESDQYDQYVPRAMREPRIFQEDDDDDEDDGGFDREFTFDEEHTT